MSTAIISVEKYDDIEDIPRAERVRTIFELLRQGIEFHFGASGCHEVVQPYCRIDSSDGLVVVKQGQDYIDFMTSERADGNA